MSKAATEKLERAAKSMAESIMQLTAVIDEQSWCLDEDQELVITYAQMALDAYWHATYETED